MAPSSFDTVLATIEPRAGGNWRALGYRGDHADLIGISHVPGAATFSVLSIVGEGGGEGCQDTCAQARDGVCDDGGPGSTTNLCEAGSDCSDCGQLSQRESCLNTCGANDDGSGSLAGNGVCEDGGPGSSSAGCGLGTDCADCDSRTETIRKPGPGSTRLLFEAPTSARIPVGVSWNVEAKIVSVLLDAQEPGGSALLRRFDESGQPAPSAETVVSLAACAGTVEPPDASVPPAPGQAAGLVFADGNDAILCTGTHSAVAGSEVTTTPFANLVTVEADGSAGDVLPAAGVLAEP
jgi:hypothetical protein